jgi:hypothetical protein
MEPERSVAESTSARRVAGRKPNWQELLCEYIEGSANREFAYGKVTVDCALFCADWVLIATDVDYAAELRGYSSLREAYKIIARYGSMEKMVTALLGAAPIAAASARCGDIVLMRDPHFLGGAPEGLGICVGVHTAFPMQKGLTMNRTHHAARAWRID